MTESTHTGKIDSLLQKYIKNRCTEEELHIVLMWLKYPENIDSFNSISESLWKQANEKFNSPEEGRKEQLNDEVDILLQKINRPEKKSFLANKVFQMCAMFILVLSVTVSIMLLLNSQKTNITYTEVKSGKGEIKEYTLKDGTKVVLNSESFLLIPSDYNGKSRYVKMVGEAFFDVTSISGKPFIIKSGEIQVKVLGTSFNVKNYTDDDDINVTVSTGKVLVNVDELDMQLQVNPSEHLIVNKVTGDLKKETFRDNKFINWINGKLYFDKTPIHEVIKILNRQYERIVTLDCENCEQLFSGIHDNKNIEAVIEAICFTPGLKYKEDKNTIILYEYD